jgi:hypothetical protein
VVKSFFRSSTPAPDGLRLAEVIPSCDADGDWDSPTFVQSRLPLVDFSFHNVDVNRSPKFPPPFLRGHSGLCRIVGFADEVVDEIEFCFGLIEPDVG